MTLHTRINAAITNIKKIDSEYWNSTLKQRLPSGAGSIVSEISTPEELEHKLRTAHWEQYDHPDCMEGCILFKTYDIKGHLGVQDIESMPDDTEFTIDDRKNTGKASLIVSGKLGNSVNFTSIILGLENDTEVVYTFHPGHPVTPSIVPIENSHGKKINKDQALRMGFKSIKIV